MSDLDKQKFVCIDCETTGLDPKNDRVIEVAAVCFDMDTIFEEMQSLIDPECLIPQVSIDIHHITQEMVQGKPLIQDVFADLLAVVKDHIIIGHGIGFDVDILANSAERHQVPSTIRKNKQLDTLRMARLYNECPVNSLESLRKHFNIALEGAHRAMSDVIVNVQVFRQLVKMYRNKNHLFEALSKPILMTHMPFGKHKGRSFKEIPLNYLQWISHGEFDGDLMFSIRSELKRRKQGNQFTHSFNPFAGL